MLPPHAFVSGHLFSHLTLLYVFPLLFGHDERGANGGEVTGATAAPAPRLLSSQRGGVVQGQVADAAVA